MGDSASPIQTPGMQASSPGPALSPQVPAGMGCHTPSKEPRQETNNSGDNNYSLVLRKAARETWGQGEGQPGGMGVSAGRGHWAAVSRALEGPLSSASPWRPPGPPLTHRAGGARGLASARAGGMLWGWRRWPPLR